MKGKGKRDGECGCEWWILGKGKEEMREGFQNGEEEKKKGMGRRKWKRRRKGNGGKRGRENDTLCVLLFDFFFIL